MMFGKTSNTQTLYRVLRRNSVTVRYFSYGASVQPSLWSVFRLSHRILAEAEGPNDGLVSVASSLWGGEAGYKGTLVGVSHLDLINWTNRLKWLAAEVTGNPRKFNAIAFYLDIAGMEKINFLGWNAITNLQLLG
jgi:triacylglycerol lipase